MNVTYITETDLPGRMFNGYELHKSLNMLGYTSNQIVSKKYSDTVTVNQILSEDELHVRSLLRELEFEVGMNSMLFPFAKKIMQNDEFKSSNIVHYHLFYNNFLSIEDFVELTKAKKSVLTVHDPWILTGHCIHPLECNKWKSQCGNCDKLFNTAFPLRIDKTQELHNIKQKLLTKVNIDLIVASDFMLKYLKESPITRHMDRIHKIPFGIDMDKVKDISKNMAKQVFKINPNNIVIGFRNTDNPIKGCKYIIDVLDKLNTVHKISLITVGENKLPEAIRNRFDVVELGWQNNENIINDFYNATDIFLMPSLAETFGLMAIEAMAHRCAVVVFKNTVLDEITFANKCGVSVKYKDTNELKDAIERLISDEEERKYRGNLGRDIVDKYYKYSDYVSKHIKLYEEILSRKEIKS